jgi:hypothetical protein
MDRGTEQAAEIGIVEGRLVLRQGEQKLWELDLETIAAVGEYTTPEGPFVEDYFLVFVAHNGDWFQAGWGSQGAEVALAELERHLGTRLRSRLANRTDLTSRVMWPQKIAEQALFEFPPDTSGGVIRRVASRMIDRRNIKLSKVVIGLLEAKGDVPSN